MTERCPTCGSIGYDDSIIPDKCTFCDGTEGGHPPTQDDLKRYWNSYDTDEEEYLQMLMDRDMGD